MDIQEVTMIGNRKRLNNDVEKLRDKVTRETAKIIKLKVAQDTAYWDLKEKLQQVEANHERLQQNMVEVQMQYETLSGQYQEELRLRPDIINKLSSNRDISEVLQEYCERLKETLSRCKVDQVALCEAYQRSGDIVKELKQKQQLADDKNKQSAAILEERVKLTNDHRSQLMDLFTAFKQQAESEISGLKVKLQATSDREQNLTKTLNEQNRELDQMKFEVDQKGEVIANLQEDIKQLFGEYNAHRSEALAVLQQKEKDLKAAKEDKDALKEALTNQEQYTSTVCDQNTKLIEKVATMEEEHQKAGTMISDLKLKVEEVREMYERIKTEMTLLNEEKDRYALEVRDKQEVIRTYTAENMSLKEQLLLKDINIKSIDLKIKTNLEDLEEKKTQIQQLTETVTVETIRADGLKEEYENYKNKMEETLRELTNTLDLKDKELDSKASTITQLMSEMKAGTDARARLEATLQRHKKETDDEREAERERSKAMTSKIENLEASVKDKDEAVAKQMSIIMEMRGEKDRLQEKIQAMQNTIDNIQKELTGRPAPPTPADLDENAVMFTPSKECKEDFPQPLSPIFKKAELTAPRVEPRVDNMLYNLFSDSSMEGDTIDASEVNRRFQAISRGEHVSSRPLSALKRRSGVPLTYTRSKTKVTPKEQVSKGDISLSQIKTDLNNKERTFFKNKHLDNKMKKPK